MVVIRVNRQNTRVIKRVTERVCLLSVKKKKKMEGKGNIDLKQLYIHVYIYPYTRIKARVCMYMQVNTYPPIFMHFQRDESDNTPTLLCDQ